MRTVVQSKNDIKKKWFVVDAQGIVLGKLASQVAHVLRGKHKPTYSPNMDDGDNVIVINCDKVKLTGNKLKDKYYYSHSGYTGSIKGVNYAELLEKKAGFAVYKAVKGMLSNNRLGRAQLKHLKVSNGAEHKYQAQKPAELKV